MQFEKTSLFLNFKVLGSIYLRLGFASLPIQYEALDQASFINPLF